MAKKIQLAVLFGGVSSEYEVSLMSAASVLKNLDAEKYDIIRVGITRDGRWRLFEGELSLLQGEDWASPSCSVPAILSPDRGDHGLLVFREQGIERRRVDVIFPVLHGRNGEDGTMQGLFELSGIPYVGCGVLASAACMDKEFTHDILALHGIPIARFIAVKRESGETAEQVEGRMQQQGIGYPVFVKPANAGSSVGISKVHGRSELMQALETAFAEDSRGKALIEETLTGVEAECAVMGNSQPVAAADVGEIEPLRELYDYEGKYCDDTTALHIPARIAKEAAASMRETALRAYALLGCEGLARVDFFILEDGRAVLNELNTLPGFTSISMYPKLFCHGGMSYSGLLDRLIGLAQEKSR